MFRIKGQCTEDWESRTVQHWRDIWPHGYISIWEKTKIVQQCFSLMLPLCSRMWWCVLGRNMLRTKISNSKALQRKAAELLVLILGKISKASHKSEQCRGLFDKPRRLWSPNPGTHLPVRLLGPLQCLCSSYWTWKIIASHLTSEALTVICILQSGASL